MNKEEMFEGKFVMFLGILFGLLCLALVVTGAEMRLEGNWAGSVISIVMAGVSGCVCALMLPHAIESIITATHEPEPVKETVPTSNIRIAEKEA